MKCPYCKKEFQFYVTEQTPLFTGEGRSLGEVLTLACPECKTFLAAVSPPQKPTKEPMRLRPKRSL